MSRRGTSRSAPAAAPTHFVANMGSYRYAEPDLRSPVIDFLPRHSACRRRRDRPRDPRYRICPARRGGFRAAASAWRRTPPRSADFVAAAELYLGCPYLWGGKSFLGIDCSGLVQKAFRDLGIAVLRDTDMQRECDRQRGRGRRNRRAARAAI